jgi:hypothetical protein
VLGLFIIFDVIVNIINLHDAGKDFDLSLLVRYVLTR